MRCVKKRGRMSKGDIWWWNEEKEAVSRMKDVHKVMCQKSTEKNEKT